MAFAACFCCVSDTYCRCWYTCCQNRISYRGALRTVNFTMGNERMNKRTKEWTNKQMKERTNFESWMNEWMHKWILSEWSNDWMHGWVDEETSDWRIDWMNKQMNEWMSEHLTYKAWWYCREWSRNRHADSHADSVRPSQHSKLQPLVCQANSQLATCRRRGRSDLSKMTCSLSNLCTNPLSPSMGWSLGPRLRQWTLAGPKACKAWGYCWLSVQPFADDSPCVQLHTARAEMPFWTALCGHQSIWQHLLSCTNPNCDPR